MPCRIKAMAAIELRPFAPKGGTNVYLLNGGFCSIVERTLSTSGARGYRHRHSYGFSGKCLTLNAAIEDPSRPTYAFLIFGDEDSEGATPYVYKIITDLHTGWVPIVLADSSHWILGMDDGGPIKAPTKEQVLAAAKQIEDLSIK